MNTPTPRTDAATYPADCLGKTLVTNRDCSRALETELTALTAERDQLHAQLRALTLICGTNDANKFETWIDRANARAERAEAELATEREKSERYRLATLKLDAELAAERARLDWLLSYDGVDWILSAHKNRKLFEGESDNRALLEAAMKEVAK